MTNNNGKFLSIIKKNIKYLIIVTINNMNIMVGRNNSWNIE